MRLLEVKGSERTTPEHDDGSASENSKSWQGAGEKEHERCRSALVTLPPQAVIAFIARAAPDCNPAERAMCLQGSPQAHSVSRPEISVRLNHLRPLAGWKAGEVWMWFESAGMEPSWERSRRAWSPAGNGAQLGTVGCQ